jgi:hypothetical protein
VVVGQVSDVSPHVLILETARGEERLTLTPDTRVWRGAKVPPSAIRPGEQVIARKTRRSGSPAGSASGRSFSCVADRVWARIGRVAGVIVESHDRELLVDEGPGRGRSIVIIEEGSLRQVQVRFPRMSPGYLIDVIGLRRRGYLIGLTPATAQPPHWAGNPPAQPLVNGHVPEQIGGTAVWHEPGREPPGLRGLAYPALDPESGCGRGGGPDADIRPGGGDSLAGGVPYTAGPYPPDPYAVDPHTIESGCVRLPYLSVGSIVTIRNECCDSTAVLPVTSCGASARLFCDRCVECGTSPRGRIADLTMAAFVELGGNLEDGCFNATLSVPR